MTTRTDCGTPLELLLHDALNRLVAQHDRPHGFADEYAAALRIAREALNAADAKFSQAEAMWRRMHPEDAA
jgi:hypothetical protein